MPKVFAMELRSARATRDRQALFVQRPGRGIVTLSARRVRKIVKRTGDPIAIPKLAGVSPNPPRSALERRQNRPNRRPSFPELFTATPILRRSPELPPGVSRHSSLSRSRSGVVAAGPGQRAWDAKRVRALARSFAWRRLCPSDPASAHTTPSPRTHDRAVPRNVCSSPAQPQPSFRSRLCEAPMRSLRAGSSCSTSSFRSHSPWSALCSFRELPPPPVPDSSPCDVLGTPSLPRLAVNFSRAYWRTVSSRV